MSTIETRGTATSGDILRGTPSVGADREVYARQVEPRPSRFTDSGAPYAEWAKRADEWARLNRLGEFRESGD